jgi:hypothetical protein
MLYDVLIAYIITFNLVDICATLWLITNQIAIEANPLMLQALEYGYSFFIFTKLILVFGGCYILKKNKDKKIARYSILVAFVVYFVLMLYFCINIVLVA